MSLDTALGIARSGLAHVQRSIAQASQNVANADTAGYTRKTAPTSAVTLDAMPMGVRTQAVQRDVDMALVAELNARRASEAASALREDMLTGIEAAHGATKDGTALGDVMAAMRTSFTALQADPSDPGAQRVVMDAAGALATKLNGLSTAVQAARQGAQDGIVAEVASINSALRRLAEITSQVKAARVGGQSTAELDDKRDLIVTELAKSIEVKAIPQGDGGLTLITRGGVVLPLDASKDALQTSPAQAGPGSFYGPGGTLPGVMLGGADITAQLTSGRLGEYVRLRDTLLPRYQAELDLTASHTAYRFDAEGLRLFSDASGNVPGIGAYAGSGQIGFAGVITVNPAILNAPNLVRDGTHAVAATPGGPTAFTPNPTTGPAGFSALITRILNFTLGDQAAASTPWATIPSTGLGGAGNLSSPFGAPRTLDGYAAQVTAVQVGDRAAASTAKAQAATLREGLETRFSAQSSVDVDAEMAAIVQLQNAYAANARVMSTVQSMWDALFAAAR